MAKILIIGGGVAGLSAGIYAQINGHQATICERHSVAGGNLTGWQRGEYHIDNCIHWLTGTNPATETYNMWKDLGALGNVEIYQGDTLYTYERDLKQLSLHKNLNKIKDEMLSLSKRDEKEILSLINAIKIVQGLMGVAGKNHNKSLGGLKKISSLPQLVKYHNLNCGELAERFYHPAIRGFLTSLMGTDFASTALLVVFATFTGEDGGIPQGGSCGMANRMVQKFLSLGGELLLNKQAVKINYSRGRATTVDFADSTQLGADYIVITADPKIAFNSLLNTKMPKYFAKWYNNPKTQRFSGYHCAFACDEQNLPFKGDFIFDISAIYRSRLHTNQLIVREFSHEKTFAPQGKNILQTLTFCTEEDAYRFINLHNDKTSYNNVKRRIANDVQTLIEAKFPQLKGKLECIDVWTPATYNRYTGSETGSFMSFLLPSKTIPRVLNNRVPGVNNVILATQWLQSPGGLPIAAKVGQTAIQTIQKMQKAPLKRYRLPKKQAVANG